ncbi:MAG: MMPL family transporter [Gammaproteobacteria bacterium]|nr:MMPL family transporter [Gammaproteobacteria bacterium]
MRRARSIVIAGWLLGLAALIVVISRTPFSTDMSAFLPRAPAPEQQALVDQLREGVASRIVLAAIEGADAATRASLSRAMAQRLRDDPAFARVENGESGGTSADQSFVWRNRYVLSAAVDAERFTAAGLRRALERDLEILASGMEPLLKASITRDPTGEAIGLAQTLGGEVHREIRAGVWTARDGARALLLFQTRAAGFDVDGQEHAVDAIAGAFAAARAAQPAAAGARLVMSGPGVFAVRTRAAMKHDVSLYSTVAMSVIVALLLLLYRSLPVLLLTLAPVVSAALAGLAAVGLCFGFVHGITVGFGITLIGEAVDYAIYLFVQSKGQGGTATTLRRIMPTLQLGVLVSICGFAAMLFSSFTGFVQLGVFTIAGLAVALGVTRFVLPRLVPAEFAWTGELVPASRLLALVQRAGALRWVLLALVAFALAGVQARRGDLWQDELSSMSPIPAADLALDGDLRRDIGAPDVRYIVTASAPDREAVLEAGERTDAVLRELVAAGVLSGFDAPGRYLPSARMQAARVAALPPPAVLRTALAEALTGLPFRPESFEPFLAEVAAARAAPPLTRAALDGTALALKVDSLLLERADRWIATLPLRDVRDPGRVSRALATLPAPARGRVVLVDLKTESDALLHRYRHEAILLALLGAVAIAGLLLVWLRSLRMTLAVLAPLAVAVIGTVGVLTLGAGRLSIFNVFGLLLVIAVGSNYCLFFLRGDLSGERGAATVGSLLAANLCTVIGFGALGLSHLPVLFDIGRTVALGTALSLVAAAILTPGLARSQAAGTPA